MYARAGANAVAFADVYGMLARAKMGGSLVWIASQTIIPQLASMVDAGSHAVWTGSQGIGNAAQAMPSTLFGYPLFFSDRMPALGSKGDLVLADLSYYMIKDGSGVFVDLSEHIYFTRQVCVQGHLECGWQCLADRTSETGGQFCLHCITFCGVELNKKWGQTSKATV